MRRQLDLYFYTITNKRSNHAYHNSLSIPSGTNMPEVHSKICDDEWGLVMGEELVVTGQIWDVQ